MTETPPRLPTPDEQNWGVGDLLGNRPFIITVLYLCTYFTGISCIIGVVLAHVFADASAEDWEQTHFSYLIRTFWMFVAFFVLAFGMAVTMIVALGEREGGLLAILVAMGVLGVFILTAARTVYSMLNAVRQKPMPRPRTWLI